MAPVGRALAALAPVLRDLREGMVLRDDEPGVGFVVAEDDVVARAQALDEVRLEEERLGLGRRGDDLEVPRLEDHAPEAVRQAVDLRVGVHALLQRAGLADVESVPPRVEHAVHAGGQGEGFERALDDLAAFDRRGRGGLFVGERHESL